MRRLLLPLVLVAAAMGYPVWKWKKEVDSRMAAEQAIEQQKAEQELDRQAWKEAHAEETDIPNWGKAADWSLSVRMKDRYERTEPVQAVFSLTNRSSKPRVFDLPGGPDVKDFQIQVTDGDGAPVALTAEGEKTFGADWGNRRGPTKVLRPGNSCDVPVDLGAYFRIDRPGQYTVTVTQYLSLLAAYAPSSEKSPSFAEVMESTKAEKIVSPPVTFRIR